MFSVEGDQEKESCNIVSKKDAEKDKAVLYVVI